MQGRVKDGWEAYRNKGLYSNEILDRLALCSWTVPLKTFIGEGVSVAGYESEGVFHSLHWSFPFMRVEWIADDLESLMKYEKSLDILNLLGEEGRGTDFVVVDIKDTVEKTLEQYSGKFGKKVRRIWRREYREVTFQPVEDKKLFRLMTYWQRYWNMQDENHSNDLGDNDVALHYDWVKIWQRQGLDIVVEGLYQDKELVGAYVMYIDGETAHGLYAPWYKERYGNRLDVGYLINLRRMELCVSLGVKELMLGTTFQFEQKKRWATRLVRTGSVGGGFY
jgi:hypothetical protein